VLNRRQTTFGSSTDGILRALIGYAKLDRQRNVDTEKRLKVQSIVEEIQTYQKNWEEHVERMQDERLSALALAASGNTR
jgi:hypothetical protein